MKLTEVHPWTHIEYCKLYISIDIFHNSGREHFACVTAAGLWARVTVHCVPTPSPTMHPPPPLLFYVATTSACALLYLGQGQPYYGLNEWLGWVHFVHPAVLA